MKTRAEPLGIKIIVGAVEDLPADKVFGAIFQYPGTHGNVRDFTKVIKELHEHKASGNDYCRPSGSGSAEITG